MNKHKCIICNTNNVIKELFDEEKNTYSYLCIRCGFTSNDHYISGDPLFEQYKSSMSGLIKDLSQIDETGKMWVPSIINSTRGMLYPFGTPLDWRWWYVPIVPITEEERKDGTYEEKYSTRLAIDKKKIFDRFEFVDALKEFGDIAIDLEVSD